MFYKVIAPCSLPFIASGVRNAISRGFVGLVSVELLVGTRGCIGGEVRDPCARFDTARGFAFILLADSDRAACWCRRRDTSRCWPAVGARRSSCDHHGGMAAKDACARRVPQVASASADAGGCSLAVSASYSVS